MIGDAAHPGVLVHGVAQVCEAASASGSGHSALLIMCSYVEIYNEHVSDLLPLSDVPVALRIVEDPLIGSYVEGAATATLNYYYNYARRYYITTPALLRRRRCYIHHSITTTTTPALLLPLLLLYYYYQLTHPASLSGTSKAPPSTRSRALGT